MRNKKLSTLILTLMLALAALITSVSLATAAVFPPTNYPTYCFLTVNPNPIGINQRVSVNFWLDKPPPNAATVFGDRWQGVTVTITKPDQKTEIKGPFALDAVGSGWTDFYPKDPGKYTFQMKFPGQWVNYTAAGMFGGPSNTYYNYYQPSEGAIVELTVQQDPIAYWKDIPLPTGYWQRPLNAELRATSDIGSYWLAAGSTGPHGPRAYNWLGNFQPYGTAPDSAHVLWTKEIAFGGSVGGGYGDRGDAVYYPGETYERKFQPPIIMQGRLYYNLRLGSSLWDGFTCIDLNTGQEKWTKIVDNKNAQPITFGQLLDFQSPNQHGVIPYLWGVSGSTYMMIDAFSGSSILNLTGVPSGSMVFGKQGEILIYTLSATTNRMTLWNSTRAINPTIDTSWSWRPSPTLATPTSPAGINVTAGYMWNETIPDVAGSQSITKICPEVIYARATLVSAPAAQVCDVAYDIKGGKKPVQLWVQNRTYEGTLMNGPMQVWPVSPGSSTLQGVFVTFVKEQMVWFGYDVFTGAQIWGPTTPYESAWGMYQPYADTSYGYGMFFAGGYDGTVHAFDMKTGDNLWNYYCGSSGFETPYGSYPFKDNALTVADGKVFAATNEHSPNTPFFHGWRLHAIDVTTGKAAWNVSYMGLAPIIADGRALALNYFDNRLYCFSTGPSATTVTASPKVIAKGGSILIEGSVTDQSPGAKGTPAIADESMSAWMEYLYEQREIPGNAKGVPVQLTAVESSGTSVDLGTVTSDMGGQFSVVWTPPAEGKYTIFATFSGTISYGASFAETAAAVTAAPAPSPTQTPVPSTPPPTVAPTTAPPTETPTPVVPPQETPNTVLYVGVATVIIVAALAAVALALRKRAK
jgi:hypothetical protein